VKEPYDANIIAFTNVAEESGAAMPWKSDRKDANDHETVPAAALVANDREEPLPLPLTEVCMRTLIVSKGSDGNMQEGDEGAVPA
jgi:hypothetical protein